MSYKYKFLIFLMISIILVMSAIKKVDREGFLDYSILNKSKRTINSQMRKLSYERTKNYIKRFYRKL